MSSLKRLLKRPIQSAGSRALSALEWRIYRPLQVKYAERHRSRLNGVTVIGITGSAGKTTTKGMATAILSSFGAVKHSEGTANRINHIAEIVISTRPTDDYCVLELSAERPGYFDRLLKVARPAIGVVTTVRDDHLKAFGTKEAIAAEKGKLIALLPPNGTAVLNADDPLVQAMAETFDGRKVSYGTGDTADLQGLAIRADWPERLSFVVRYQGRDVPVRTQLCGDHWVTSVLAALATAVAAGIDLADAADAVASVTPDKARMEPVTTSDGITFIRDDWKASLWTIPTVLNFMKNARADRKVVVIGTLSDYHGTTRNKYQVVGRQALDVADDVIFVGKMATLGLRAQKYVRKGQSLKAFPDIEQASAELRKILRPGDLVLLKGAGPADHLGRLYLHRTGPVACWRLDCGKDILCDVCPMLRPSVIGREASIQDVPPESAEAEVPAGPSKPAAPLQVFVGIGNPGDKYKNTPHNAGFAVLDWLAERFGLTWEDVEQAQITRMKRNGNDVLLVKPQTYVNNTGTSLLALSESVGFTAADCVLVQDDIHLPIGKVRTRLKGSDGGHLGVRSAIVAFQTSDIGRIKVGVGSEETLSSPAEYLVSPFSQSLSSEIETAYEAAADRLLELASKPRSQRR